MKKLIIICLILLLAGCSANINYYSPEHIYRMDKTLITFDDGPTKNTEEILDILQEHDIKAAFFLTGKNAEKYPEIVKRIAEEGHYIGNHTFNHINLNEASVSRGKYEILETQRVLDTYTTLKWFRPPFGQLNEELNNWLLEQEYKIVRWSCTDYTELKSGDILLLHETDDVIKELPKIIKKVKDLD